jgi:hypothetical protein
VFWKEKGTLRVTPMVKGTLRVTPTVKGMSRVKGKAVIWIMGVRFDVWRVSPRVRV